MTTKCLHQILLDGARDAIDELFGDTSVSQQRTISSLQELQGHIQICIEAIRADLRDQGDTDAIL